MQWRMQQQQGPPEDFVIATGHQENVRRFIELTALELGWGAIEWENTKSDGTPKKQMNISRMKDLGWSAQTPLSEGIASTVAMVQAQWLVHSQRESVRL